MNTTVDLQALFRLFISEQLWKTSLTLNYGDARFLTVSRKIQFKIMEIVAQKYLLMMSKSAIGYL